MQDKQEEKADNVLIAEFDGWHFSKSGRTARKQAKDARCSPYRLGDLHYHTSWDWLMPACKKAYDICQQQERPNVNACNQLDWLECCIGTHLREYDINATHAALIEFIKHYNLNKQSDEQR